MAFDIFSDLLPARVEDFTPPARETAAPIFTSPESSDEPISFGDVTSDDEPVRETPPTPPPSGAPVCEVCGVEIPYAGRGRKPKRCQDHKVTRTNTSGYSGPAMGDAPDPDTKRRLKSIHDDLMFGVGQMMGPIAPFAPVTAATLGLAAPDGIDGILKIAAKHPKMLDGLEAVASGIPYVAVAKFAAAMALAISVDIGKMMPVGTAAEYLHVAEAARVTNWQPPPTHVDGEFRVTPENNGSSVTPPRFTMPGPIKTR